MEMQRLDIWYLALQNLNSLLLKNVQCWSPTNMIFLTGSYLYLRRLIVKTWKNYQ